MVEREEGSTRDREWEGGGGRKRGRQGGRKERA